MGLAFLCLALALISAPCFAKTFKTASLNEDKIQSFIKEMTDLTSNSKASSFQDIKDFLDIHLHPSSRFKSNLTFYIPGYPPQSNAISLDKGEFIESVKQGHKTVDNFENSVDISNIQISSDGKKATLKTTTHEEGYMSMPGDSSGQKVPIHGESICSQVLWINDENVIQLYNANCKTTIRFQGY